MSEKARAQHYLFAHRIFPRTVLQGPIEALDGLYKMARDGVADRALSRLWSAAGQMAAEAGESTIPGGPRAVVVADMIVVELPTPERVPEAYYVLVAPTAAGPRYFTLEHGLPSSMIGEWHADGRHGNLGPCAAELRAFVARIGELRR